MIFILKESILNGTVTMQTIVTGIEADSFKEAINKLKEFSGYKNLNAEINNDTEEYFSYSILFKLHGIMDNKSLKMLGEK